MRDRYDHTLQVMDRLETYRHMTGSMLDIYLSSVSNRMNDIIRVLMMIATIFVPLTFIVSVYGMNFDARQPLEYAETRLALPLPDGVDDYDHRRGSYFLVPGSDSRYLMMTPGLTKY